MMLKVVVFDSGYGGELFADYLKEAIPILEVIRVIDWRNANKIQSNPKLARKIAQNDLLPHIGKVDLIFFANHLLSITSLKYFERKYPQQKFLGFSLKRPETFIKRDTLILTTSPVTRTIAYYNFLFHLKRRSKTLALDAWPAKIDDEELKEADIHIAFDKITHNTKFKPEEVILACAQFNDIKPELRQCFGSNLRIYDSFDDAVRKTCQVLKIRGGLGKK